MFLKNSRKRYKSTKYGIIVEIDRKHKKLTTENIDESPEYSGKNVLSHVSSELAEEIEQYFDIRMSSYSVICHNIVFSFHHTSFSCLESMRKSVSNTSKMLAPSKHNKCNFEKGLSRYLSKKIITHRERDILIQEHKELHFLYKRLFDTILYRVFFINIKKRVKPENYFLIEHSSKQVLEKVIDIEKLLK